MPHHDEREGERSDKRARVYEEDINTRQKQRRRYEDDHLMDIIDSDQGFLGFGGIIKPMQKKKLFETNYDDDSRRRQHTAPGTGSVANAAGVAIGGPITMIMPSTGSANTSDSRHSPATYKVSSISKTYVSSISKTYIENKGVNVNRSHEVPGKSTIPDARKSGSLSLDALPKAKRALQLHKDLVERMKRIPPLNRPDAGNGSPKVVAKISPNTKGKGRGILPMPAAVTTQSEPPSRAPVLRLDALGREIDEHGNVVLNVPKVNSLISTLMVNINKQKKESFRILKPQLEVDPVINPYFDARMGIDRNKLLTPRRMTFQFVEEGKWSKDAQIVKLNSQFGEAKAKDLKAKEAHLAMANAEPNINPNLIQVGQRVFTKEKPKDSIPDVEWWDVPLLKLGTYCDVVDGDIYKDQLMKMDKMTMYVEHPRPIEPPAEAASPPPQPLKLTKKEQKKLRTQRRLARAKDRQEMIRLGVLEPPKPKVKMSNLMKVLGSEAAQDPTRLEMEIRSAAAEREQAHIDRSISRKLTPSERREKKERKLFDDLNTLDTIVSVYKVNDLSHTQARFKVDINAKENRLTGCAIILQGICVVVVEGGAKSIKRYGKLMLRRIDWTASVKKEEDDDHDEDKPVNKCVLVWQGSVAKPSFSRFSVQECRTETAARTFFSDFGVAHYWDPAVNFVDDTV